MIAKCLVEAGIIQVRSIGDVLLEIIGKRNHEALRRS